MPGLAPTPSNETPDLAAAVRAAMRSVAATVTLISAEHSGRRYGMVATAIMSVSLEPPALAICVNRSASVHEPIRHRGAFAVNVLSDRQQSISRHFSHSKGEDRFRCGTWNFYQGSKSSLRGLPYLEDANAVFLGRVREQIEFGTHTLFVAEIDELLGNHVNGPLVYCDGTYGGFAK